MKKILFSLIAILITLECWSQTCIAPTNLSSVQSGNNRIISWTSGGSETQWLLQYSLSTDTSFVNSTSVNLVSNQDTIRGLNPSTSYKVRVRAICSATDSSSWSSSYSFNTGCITISSLPWYESFDSYGISYPPFSNMISPTCWSMSCYGTAIPYIYTYCYSSPGSFYIKSLANQYTIVMTPRIDNSIPINTLRAKFKLLKSNINCRLSIGVMSNTTDTSSFTEIAVVSPSILSAWEDFEVWFDSYTGSGKYIAFKSNDTISNSILLDNLELSSIPSCLNPTNLAANNISTTSASISWASGQNETQWTLEYKPSTTSWTNATTINNITSNNYTLTGLYGSTAYDVRVKAVCSSTNESEWSNISFYTVISSLPWSESFDSYGTDMKFPFAWTKLHDPLTSTSSIFSIHYSNPASLRLLSSANSNLIVISPKFDTSIHINTLRAKLKIKIYDASNGLSVGVMSNPNDTSSFVQIEELMPTELETWKDFEVWFNSYTGSGQYIAFKSNTPVSNNVYLDNIEISLLPSCIRPTNIRATNFSSTNATISWTSNGNENQWVIEYKPSTDSSWNNAATINNITNNSYTLTGLSNTKVYDLRIKAICSTTDESEWSNIFRFASNLYGNNFDFSLVNYTNWKAYQARNISTDSTTSFTNWTNIVDPTVYNPYGLNCFAINSDTTANDTFVTNLRKIPSGYTHSTKINLTTNYGYGNSNMLTYDLDIDYSNCLITFNYALIFKSTNFIGHKNPSFNIEILNLDTTSGSPVENGRIDPNIFVDIVGSTSPPTWNTSSTWSDTKYLPWKQFSVDLSNHIGQKARIKLMLASSSDNNYWAFGYFAGKLDGIITPTCFPPSNLIVSNITSTSAVINFNTHDTNDNEWKLLYREVGDTLWNSTNIDTNHYQLNGLIPNANYEALLLTLCSDSTYSDSSQVVSFHTNTLNIDSYNNNSTAYLCEDYLFDDGGDTSNHGSNYNYTFTLCPTYRSNGIGSFKRSSVHFDEFNLGQGDVMRAYSGRNITPQTQLNIENINSFTGNFLQGKTLVSNLGDTSGCITFNIITDSTGVGTGFKAKIECIDRCQYPIAALDTFFIKYDALGNMSTHLVRDVVDSVYSSSNNTWDLINYKSIDLCQGDSIVLIAKPLFPYNDVLYHQSLNNCIYNWSFGDGQNQTVNYNNTVGHKCNGVYNLNLTVTDSNYQQYNEGICASNNLINTRIRLSINPIKTVNPLPDMCSGETFFLNVDYSTNSNIVVDSIKFKNKFIGLFDSTVFIPDGPQCGGLSYFNPIYFNQFRSDAVVTSVNDISSLCMNIEHSYAGDLGYRIYCPNGSSVWLAYNRHNFGNQLGVPNDSGGNCCAIDLSTPGSNCYPGTGWTYCWSNKYLTNARGIFNDSASPGRTTDSTYVSDTSGYFQTPTQTGQILAYNGDCYANCNTLDLNGFSPLIGCPLNGEWKLEVRDNFGSDNGFVFWWSVELRLNTVDYQVTIDTVIWNGPFTHAQTSTTTLVNPPITDGGNYRYDVEIVDDFGCTWDTATYLNVAQTPIVNLGGDTSNCEQFSLMLDAGNIGATSYLWLPTGDTIQSILAQSFSSPDSSITYIAQVTNYNGSIYCFGIDSINLIVNPTPNTPTNLVVQARPTYLEITWSGNGTSYEVYRNDSLIALSSQPIYFDSNVVDGTNYCYKIKALIENCESELSNIICRTYTGLENIINNDLSVIIYPNPTNDKTRLEIKGLKSNADVIVYDIYGRAIKTYKLNANQNELEIDVKEFAKGVYNVKVTNSDCNITKKLIVK